MVTLGDADSAFAMIVPDVRLPPNQFWPLHWHDCWTVVLILEGTCCIGDWWMQPGDVFVTVPSLEYGPLVSGPEGCRLFEIFAQAHLSRGGYSPEYRDHPTLQGGNHVFTERSDLNRRNAGRQMLPLDGVEGIWKAKLGTERLWHLGDAADGERGLMKDSRLAAGAQVPGAAYKDWYAILVLDGSVDVEGRTIGRDELLLIKPGGEHGSITAGAGGAHLLELARTAAGAAERILA